MRFKMGYLQIFSSMASLIKEENRLVLRSLSVDAHSLRSVHFSTIAVLLSGPAFQLPDFMIGLIPLMGIFGALSTQWIGKQADKGYTRILTWIGCGLLGISWIAFYFTQHSLISYVTGFGIIHLVWQ